MGQLTLAPPDHLAESLAGYRLVFPRADQFRHFTAYVRGLLDPATKPTAGGAAQALQHFVGNSPWDADALFAAYRRQVADPAAVWVVHDGVFPKKGRHSAGAFRQLDRSTGRKLGCQVGVFVTAVGPRGVFPLAARLYLPTRWLLDNPAAAGRVPEPYRRPLSKPELAAELLARLRAEGSRSVVACEGYTDLGSVAAPEVVRAVGERFDWLKAAVGLAGFEGRTWVGWHHHVALAVVAGAYRAQG